MSVEKEETCQFRGKPIDKMTAIVKTTDESKEDFLAVNIWGSEKIQRIKEAQVSGVPQEMVVTVSSRKWESNNGKEYYSTDLNLKYLLGSVIGG